MLGFNALATIPLADDGRITNSVFVTGLAATALLGNTVVEADGAVEVLGNAATGEIGTVSTEADAIVAVTGVQAIGEIGTILTWGLIIPGGDPQWGDIAPITQIPQWADIAPIAQTPDWEDIAA